MIKVCIVQPVVPHYRVALFRALADRSDLKVTVHASRKVPGCPSSVLAEPWSDLSHDCSTLLGHRIFWQHRLTLPSGFGRGDLLVINGNPRFISNAPIAVQARRAHCGLLWWGHGQSPTSRTWRSQIRIQLMRRADVILVYTEREADELRASIPRSIPMFGLNNTLALAPVSDAIALWNSTALRAFRKSQGLEATKLLLFCGRLRSHPSCELAVAIKALKELTNRDPSYILAVIGSGPEEASLKALASSLKVDPFIRWLGPLYEEDLLAPWFLSADCFVYPGSIGLSLMHAFGYGLPVITHADRQAHNPEIDALVDGCNGMTFRRGSARELALRIGTLCQDGRLKECMSVEALRTVNGRFSFEHMVDTFVEALHLASGISRTRG